MKKWKKTPTHSQPKTASNLIKNYPIRFTKSENSLVESWSSYVQKCISFFKRKIIDVYLLIFLGDQKDIEWRNAVFYHFVAPNLYFAPWRDHRYVFLFFCVGRGWIDGHSDPMILEDQERAHLNRNKYLQWPFWVTKKILPGKVAPSAIVWQKAFYTMTFYIMEEQVTID